MKKVLTVTMDGIRYHASRPADCRHCFFWKNRKKGCVLGKENCYYPVSYTHLDHKKYLLRFLHCSREMQEVQDSLGCADKKATKLLRELEEYSLIERKRRGLGKPCLLYTSLSSSWEITSGGSI